MEPQSLDDTVRAGEQAQVDNRLSTQIAKAREMAGCAHAEPARSDSRWRLGGIWVTIDDAWAEPHEPATRGDD